MQQLSEQETAIANQTQQERMLPAVYIPPSRVVGARLKVTIGLAFLLTLILLGGEWVVGDAPTAISLTPKHHDIQRQFQRVVSTHIVQSTSPVQQMTVATTGNVHQDAQTARGIITLYNGAPDAITLDAGTSITTPAGITIVFDKQVPVPKINYQQAEAGIATVSAHISTVGSQGNLAAYTLRNVICCGQQGNIRASNITPFTGGQDAMTYRTVTSGDVKQAENMVESGLVSQTGASLRGQLAPGEHLSSTPAVCTPTMRSDHLVGSRADQVTVEEQVTCQGTAYAYTSQQAMSEAVQRANNQPAFPAPFTLTVITDVQVQENGTSIHGIVLEITGHEQWTYQWSKRQLNDLRSELAGLPIEQAQGKLNSLDGIATSSIHQYFWAGNSIASDPKNISVTLMLA